MMSTTNKFTYAPSSKSITTNKVATLKIIECSYPARDFYPEKTIPELYEEMVTAGKGELL